MTHDRRWSSGEVGADQAQTGIAPGKRTRTMDLPGRGLVQRKVAFGGASAEAAALDEAAAAGIATPAGPLPHLATIQAGFGHHRVDHVRAHTDDAAAASAASIGAEAFAVGDHVVLGPAPTLHTVAHEAAHVVQQRGGVARKGGGAVDWLERHADAVADQLVAGRSAEGLLDAVAGGGTAGGSSMQRKASIGGVVLRGPEQLARYGGLSAAQRRKVDALFRDPVVHDFRDAVALYESLEDDWDFGDGKGAGGSADGADDAGDADDADDKEDAPSLGAPATTNAAPDPATAATTATAATAATAPMVATTALTATTAAAEAKGVAMPTAAASASAGSGKQLTTTGAQLLAMLGREGGQPGVVTGLIEALDVHAAQHSLASVSAVIAAAARLRTYVDVVLDGDAKQRDSERGRILGNLRRVLDPAHAERARLLGQAFRAAPTAAAAVSPSTAASSASTSASSSSASSSSASSSASSSSAFGSASSSAAFGAASSSADSSADSKAADRGAVDSKQVTPASPVAAAVAGLPEAERKSMASILRLQHKLGFAGTELTALGDQDGPAILQNWLARGDMYHVAAVLRLYPDVKVVIYDLDFDAQINSEADEVRVRERARRWDQACQMAEYYGAPGRVHFSSAPGIGQRASAGAAYDLHEAVQSGRDRSSLFIEVGGCTTLVGLRMAAERRAGPEAYRRARADLADSVAPDHKDPARLARTDIEVLLAEHGWQAGTRYVIVNFRQSGHDAIQRRLAQTAPRDRAGVARAWNPAAPQAGGNHPELDTGTVGVEQLGEIVRERGFAPVFMGEEPSDAKQPHLIRYWDFPIVHGATGTKRKVNAGGRADEAYFMRVLAETYDVRLLAMRSGVTDQLAFLGIPTISIDIDNFHRTTIPEVFPRPGFRMGDHETAHSWARGTKLEAGLGRGYGRVFLQEPRPLADFDEDGQWRGSIGESDRAAIGDAVDHYFGPDPGAARGLRHHTHPLHPAQLDQKHNHPGQLAQSLLGKIDTGLNPDAVLADVRLMLAHYEPTIAAAITALRSHVEHTRRATLSLLQGATATDLAAGRPAGEALADAAHGRAERLELEADEIERRRLGLAVALEAARGAPAGADDGDAEAADAEAADAEAADAKAADAEAADAKAAAPARQVTALRRSLRRAERRLQEVRTEARQLRVQAGEHDRIAAAERAEVRRRFEGLHAFLDRADAMIDELAVPADPDDGRLDAAGTAAPRGVASSAVTSAAPMSSSAASSAAMSVTTAASSATSATTAASAQPTGSSEAQALGAGDAAHIDAKHGVTAPPSDEKAPRAATDRPRAPRLLLAAEVGAALRAEVARLRASLPRP